MRNSIEFNVAFLTKRLENLKLLVIDVLNPNTKCIKTYKVEVKCNESAKNTLGAICANKHIHTLGFGEENREEVVKISKKFGVLSNHTALISKIKVTQNLDGINSVEMHAPLPQSSMGIGSMEIYVKTLTGK